MRYENLKYSDDILPILFRRSQRHPNKPMYLHWHEAVELVLVLEGELSIQNNTDRFQVREGDLICVHSNHLHVYDMLGKTAQYFCFIIPTEVIGSQKLYESPLPYVTRDVQCVELFYKAATAMEEKGEFYRELVKGLLCQLYVALVNLGGEQTLGDERRVTVTIRTAMEYISEHYNEELNVERVAQAAGISRYHLCHIFKSVTGGTVAHYWQSVRCDNARHMLRKGYSVAETAGRCGFASSTYFAKVYQQYFGLLPKKDRRQ